MRTGYFQVYTGNGKGKTTAAIGLAVRAAGAGFKVLFAQFIKGIRYSEIAALERFGDLITVRQYGRSCFIDREPQQEDIDAAVKGLREVANFLEAGNHDLVILDEANVALHYGLFALEDFMDAILNRALKCEVVSTGRDAPREIMDAADLVTEMVEVRHYYTRGITARIGIER